MKLHDRGAGAEPSSPASKEACGTDRPNATQQQHETAGLVSSRKRCHTACNRCREMKVKCDGTNPCAKCSKSGLHCTFDRSLGRNSFVQRVDGTNSPPSHSESTDFWDPWPVSAITETSSMTLAPESSTGTGKAGDETPLDGMTTAWPWLHENLFLFGDGLETLGSVISPEMSGDFLSETPSFRLTEAQGDSGLVTLPEFMEQSMTPTVASAAAPTTGPPNRTSGHVYGIEDAAQTSINSVGREPTLEAALNHGNVQPAVPASTTEDALQELVTIASRTYPSSAEWASIVPNLWLQTSFDFASMFRFESSEWSTTTENAIKHFVKLYTEQFHPLWPLLPRRNLDNLNIHPLLYLVLVSIGAMYSEGSGAKFGAALHQVIRQRLLMPIELDLVSDDSTIWLAQARLHTQVAALYFGQQKAFSYAQHLGALLVAQGRRIGLFSSSQHKQRLHQFRQLKGKAPPEVVLSAWFAIEERRRLAFGLFRGDTFTSVLLNSRPLISLEEIGLEFPCYDSVWNGSGQDAQLALEMLDYDTKPSHGLRASDVFSVLLEKDETLPPLEPLAHELLLFGLQSLVWRHSWDRQSSESLTRQLARESEGLALATSSGDREFSLDTQPPKKRQRRGTVTMESETLDGRSYEMTDFREDRRRLSLALSKWESALPSVKSFIRTKQDRNYLLSSLVLFHLSFIRLHAPVEDICLSSYKQVDSIQASSNQSIAGIRAWALHPSARVAIERVRSIWSLIKKQTDLGSAGSKINFNALVSLHYGAAVVWAYMGARNFQYDQDDQESDESSSEDTTGSPTFSLAPSQMETSRILSSFVEILSKASFAGSSSFAKATKIIVSSEFPSELVRE
ncbi:hypothetical protein IL306_013677 [Fusarium sp. DS 682]|nr:hypothetical protein IL306_013677 [Fusarium sp. DS 682]